MNYVDYKSQRDYTKYSNETENVERERPALPNVDPRGINVLERIKCCKEDKEKLPKVKDDFVTEGVLESKLRVLEEEMAILKEANIAADFRSSLSVGGSVVMSDNVHVVDGSAKAKNVVSSDASINFSDKIVTLDLPDANSETENWICMEVSGGNVVFDANGGGVVTAPNPELYAVVVKNGANLTINEGQYIGGTTAVQATDGIVTINGGFYQAQTGEDARYTLNCIDAAYKSGKANFIVKGGTFVNFDPSNNLSEGPNTNYVPEGYTVVAEAQDNGDVWYTVVAAE